MTRKSFLQIAAAAVTPAVAQDRPLQPNPDLGFTDTPMLPGLPYHVHDPARPHPKVVTPAAVPGGPPSDAIVLFDGKDLSKWAQRGRGADAGKMLDARWKVAGGYFEATPRSGGDLYTREKFGDCQLHIEWASPAPPEGTSQARGNSGVMLMARYEIQVLDAWENPTYADGQAGSIYGQWPPLANPAKRPGEWNTYDILFEAPRFEGEKLARAAYITVFYNGVMVHHHKEMMGPMVYRQVARYRPHGEEDSLMIQDHNNPVRYRNVWVRRIPQYDAPQK